MALGCALAVAGCGGGGSNAGSSPTPQVTVTVSGVNQVRLGSTAQYSAVVANSTTQAVTWQVNGVAGGAAATGTISATGLYTPPGAIPIPDTVTVSAVSGAASGSLTASVWNPQPMVSKVVVTQQGSGTSYLVDVQGGSFVAGAQIEVGGTPVTTKVVSPSEAQASITVAAGTTSVAVDLLNPSPGSAASGTVNAPVLTVMASLPTAARLLDQATFGPTLTDIQHVQAIGVDAYLNEQFAAPTTLLPDITNPPPTQCATNVTPCEQSEWWQTMLTGNDQLRQRVAFAMSEMFVISTNSVNARAVTPYQNMLANDAFGNFYTMMRDVTLSPGMGAYLNMLHSYKPGNGQIANENFARELMQLFTTGLYLLNADGTVQLDGAGNPRPVYTQAQVQAFARAYTGWTYATATGGSPTTFPNYAANYDAPMAAVQSAHDLTAKVLLDGTTLPAGQSADQDLTGALTNLFNHPNVGPFVCRQLIQHLVSSNPSPAYVGRVAAVFADDGTKTRGNLKAAVRAILTDSEARAGDDPLKQTLADSGHLREPMLWMTGVMRGLGYANTSTIVDYSSLSNYAGTLGEKPYGSGSVFNFFPPDYVIPATTENAPEFGLENTASAVLRLTLADNFVSNRISNFKVDLSATSALGLMASKTGNAATDSANLVDALGTIFLHGLMPPEMRTAIVNHVSTLTDPAQRVRVATYLVVTSSLYKVEH